MGDGVLDRLANTGYQIVIEGTSYRERLSPHRALLGKVAKILSKKGGDWPANSFLSKSKSTALRVS